MKYFRLLGLLVLLLIGLLTGACGTGARVSQTNGQTGPTGEPVADIMLPTLDDGTFRLSESRGRPVVLYALAYWCGTCLPEARALGELHEKYGDRIQIVAIDVDPTSTPRALQAFKTQAGDPDYIWAFDADGVFAKTFGVRALDSTYIIAANGVLVYQDTVPTSYDVLEREIKNVLGE